MKKTFIIISLLFFSLSLSAQDVIHLLSAEVRGLHGTGGLQHVIVDKALALAENGHEVRIVLPYYTSLEQLALKDVKEVGHRRTVSLDKQGDHYKIHADYQAYEFSHPENKRLKIIGIKHIPGDGHQSYFYNNTNGGPKVYTLHSSEGEAFGFFSKAYVDFIDQTSKERMPNIVILNDWHTGAIAPMLNQRKEYFARSSLPDSQKPKIPKVCSVIHNIQYQGNFDNYIFGWMDISPKLFSSMEFNGQINFIKSMIEHSDFVETVSYQYANEILTPQYGEGLDGVLRQKLSNGRFSGIINGIDPKIWNPENPNIKDDRFKNLSFNQVTIENTGNGKELGKKQILKDLFGGDTNPKSMLVSITARVDEQKGFAFLLGDSGLFNRLLSDPAFDLKIAIAGDPHGSYDQSPLIQKLRDLQQRFPGKLSINKFSPLLERKLLYYSDFYLGASLFEPSGLPQMFSQSVGTIPILSAVGGHKDSVIADETGFLFKIAKYGEGLDVNKTVENALGAFRKAQDVFRNESKLLGMRKQIMKLDNSWNARMKYVEQVFDLVKVDQFGEHQKMPHPERPVVVEQMHRRLLKNGSLCNREFISIQ